MIPKIIHYTWFSGDPFPEKIQHCIELWKEIMPDYEFVLWNANKIKEIDSVWLSECLNEKKWAFAADYVRLYAVYHYGGIYLDTDVEVYRNFDSFLNDKMFIGREGVAYTLLEKQEMNVFLTSHCFGAEKNHPFIRLCLEYYKDHHFVINHSDQLPKHMHLDMLMMPLIQSEIAKPLGYDASIYGDKQQVLMEGELAIYPTTYFGGFWDHQITEVSVARHFGVGGWREPDDYHPQKREDKTVYNLKYKILWRLRRLQVVFAKMILFGAGKEISNKKPSQLHFYSANNDD